MNDLLKRKIVIKSRLSISEFYWVVLFDLKADLMVSKQWTPF